MHGGPGHLAAVLERSRAAGLLGPGPIERHIDQADAFLAASPTPPARLLDLGTGGGVPGLVLAQRWPDTEVLLLEAQAKRSAFLREAVDELGFGDRVTVQTGRAEEVARDPGRRHAFPVVTARSFGSPAVTAECGAPFLELGGLLVVAEPPGGDADRWSTDGLATLELVDLGIVRTAAGTVRRLQARAACPDRFPRRVGIPAKRPLFS